MNNNDDSNFKRQVEGISKLGTGRIDQSRGHNLNKIMVDINSINNEKGKKNTCVLVYVRPDINPESIKPHLIKTCQTLFGAKMDTRYFDTTFIPANSVELATGERGAFNCFDITIKYPKSSLYNIDGLKSVFLNELNRRINE